MGFLLKPRTIAQPIQLYHEEKERERERGGGSAQGSEPRSYPMSEFIAKQPMPG